MTGTLNQLEIDVMTKLLWKLMDKPGRTIQEAESIRQVQNIVNREDPIQEEL